MSSTTKALESLQRHIPEHWQLLVRAHPVALSVTAATAVSGLWWVASDYAAFKSLGRGGAPYNIFGWLISRTLGLFVSLPQRAIRDTATLRKQLKETSRVKILDLPERLGVQPEVQGVVPQRQVTQRGTKVFQDDLNKYLSLVASSHPELFFVARSLNEGGTTTALFLRSPSDSLLHPTPLRQNELAHVHPIDGALHVPLSMPDVVEVLEKGWGARHRLAGKLGGEVIPEGLTLIYSPRSVEEVEVVKDIVRASLEFKTGMKVTV